MNHSLFSRSLFALVGCGLAVSAYAIPTQVTSQDDPNCCDVLSVPTNVHELGIGLAVQPFPANELISATDQLISIFACPSNAVSGIASTEVKMTNLTGLTWGDVWYVADFPDTRISNWDGSVNGSLAFKIDSLGINTPLIAESISNNGVFDIGETWNFVIDGYQNNFGLPASAFNSVGVGSLSIGDQISSGSIIAVELKVPEPASVMLLLGGGLGLLATRRQRS